MRIVIIGWLLVQWAAISSAEDFSQRPFVHPLFSDNMVIQRDATVPIWGWAECGSRVTVNMAGKSAVAVADNKGKWVAKLGPFKPGGPYTLTLSGQKSSVISNVMVGDVWICSGQSNMELSISAASNADEEIANADYPRIRLFKVPHKIAFSPRETVDSGWRECTPDAIRREEFSAVGYFFGRALHCDLGVPIGLIQSAWGGTVAEAWTSAEALSTMADFRNDVAGVQENLRHPDNRSFAEKMMEWFDLNDAVNADIANWTDPSFNSSGWSKMTVPNDWRGSELADFDGIVWFRNQIDLPADWAGEPAALCLGRIDDLDTTWVNGIKIGATIMYNSPRRYSIPAGVLRAGRNVIAVRVLDTGGLGGLYDSIDQMVLTRDGACVSIGCDWQYSVAHPLAKLSPLPVSYADNPNVATVIYNGMIAPLVPYSIKGAIWYQGEANVSRPAQYARLLPTLISDWRSRFQSGRFPFLIVQLSSFTDPTPEPVQSGWAELREAQLVTALKVPNCGIAVTTDIGDAKDIHPKNKQDVGHRLALAAEAIAHGRKIEYSGPIYIRMRIEGKSVRLYFDHIGKGLVARGGHALRGFAIAGADKKFVWADAVIDGETVVVSAESVDKPVAVRYNWANFPCGNLYNNAGLPASGFRSDPE
ncbi:MAG: sialate O-acetylesterase [Armatimonadota bacterium]